MRITVGPMLPITAMKQVTCSDSRRRSSAASPRRTGSHCRSAAKPMRTASGPRW